MSCRFVAAGSGRRRLIACCQPLLPARFTLMECSWSPRTPAVALSFAFDPAQDFLSFSHMPTLPSCLLVLSLAPVVQMR